MTPHPASPSLLGDMLWAAQKPRWRSEPNRQPGRQSRGTQPQPWCWARLGLTSSWPGKEAGVYRSPCAYTPASHWVKAAPGMSHSGTSCLPRGLPGTVTRAPGSSGLAAISSPSSPCSGREKRTPSRPQGEDGALGSGPVQAVCTSPCGEEVIVLLLASVSPTYSLLSPRLTGGRRELVSGRWEQRKRRERGDKRQRASKKREPREAFCVTRAAVMLSPSALLPPAWPLPGSSD